MDEKKVTNGSNEVKRPAPPPVVPKKQKEANAKAKGTNKKVFIIIPVIIAIIAVAVIVAVVLKNSDKNKGNDGTTLAPVVVTDANGVPVTNADGEVVTVVPETEVHEYTNARGENKTTIVYKDVAVNVPVTNAKGEIVTDKNGENVTEQVVIKPTIRDDGTIIVGTTSVAVTDGQGNTAVDNQGNIFTTIVEITSTPSVVDSADIDWKSAQGGTAADYFSSVKALKDGGYITSVVTNSIDGDFAKYKELDYDTPYTVLTKYSKSGDIVWQNALGNKRGITVITDLVVTEDGGFYAVGYGNNVGGANGKGYYDGAVFKFNEKGEQLWFKKFGTTTVDLFNSGALTKDGGIVVAGSVGTNDGDAKGFGKPAYESAAALVKYNSDGSLAWKNIVGGDKDSFSGVVEGTDGNIYCVGNFYSGVLFKGLGSADSGISKFTSNGEYVETARIAGSGIESFKDITACKDGGVAVVGKSNSSDAGTTESMFVSDLASRGGYDSYIMKYNFDLSLVFARVFRGQNDDDLTCITETEEGSFIVAGSSNSSTRDFKGVTTRGGEDIVIASFDKFGSLTWARSFGGTNSESANAICLGSDGGYLVAGRSLSKDIDLKELSKYGAGKSIAVIVKFPE